VLAVQGEVVEAISTDLGAALLAAADGGTNP